MNPYRNRFESLKENALGDLFLADGRKMPKHWAVFKVGDNVVVKDYTFKIAHMGETYMVLEPVAPIVINETEEPINE